jgi:hypothetical protein
MRTSYKNFYEHYQTVDSLSDSIKKLKNQISKDFKNWSDLELALGKYTENLNSIEEFDEVFEDIGDNLSVYLQQEENKFDFSKIDRKNLFNYLSFPEKSILKADEEKLNIFKSQWSKHQWIVNVITFNYTSTLEKILGDKFENKQISAHDNTTIILGGVEHIHGYLNNRMIIGVNDISQIVNTAFHDNHDILDAIVKNNCNQAHKHTIEESCKRKIKSANLICIFGSSIGETDNLWWSMVGKQLLNNCKLIIFEISENVSPNRAYKNLRKERKIKQFFLDKLDLTETEKQHIANNIVISINSDIFNLLKDKENID